ncbi:hypothetical protein [Nocardioides sp.]|uniref:hypothetical protein n=1 Tax=Nocardioides sp. TaxID=35761 RepID=UPI003512EE8A
MSHGAAVEDGSDGHFGAGDTAPALDLVEGHGDAGVLESSDAGAGFEGGLGEVDVEGQVPAVLGFFARGAEVECELLAAELSERHGPSDLEGVLATGGLQVGGDLAQGPVEVEGVSGIEGRVHLDHAVGPGSGGADQHPAPVGRSPSLLSGECGVVGRDRRSHGPVELREGARVRVGRETSVDVLRDGGVAAVGAVRDQPGPPHRHLPGQHPHPQAREAGRALLRG